MAETISPSTMVGQYNTTPPTVTDGKSTVVQTDDKGRLITTPGGSAPVGGGITWGAPTAVTLTGSSQDLVAANAARKGIMIINRSGNAAVSYDLAGGTVTLVGGIQMQPGYQRDWYLGAACPVGKITVIGTAAQLVTYVEGT